MSNNVSLSKEFTSDQLPQDPFFPTIDLFGPIFLDTEACFCALRHAKLDVGKETVAWQCVGDQTRAYETLEGKWFPTKDGNQDIPEDPNDGSNPPDRGRPLFYDPAAKDLVDLRNPATLGVYNGACTAVNNTKFSQSIYEAYDQLDSNQYPISGAPCFRPGAIPLKIQNADSWGKDGCSPGFLCKCMPYSKCGYAEAIC